MARLAISKPCQRFSSHWYDQPHDYRPHRHGPTSGSELDTSPGQNVNFLECKSAMPVIDDTAFGV